MATSSFRLLLQGGGSLWETLHRSRQAAQEPQLR